MTYQGLCNCLTIQLSDIVGHMNCRTSEQVQLSDTSYVRQSVVQRSLVRQFSLEQLHEIA